MPPAKLSFEELGGHWVDLDCGIILFGYLNLVSSLVEPSGFLVSGSSKRLVEAAVALNSTSTDDATVASILSKKEKQKQKTTRLSDLRTSRTHINNLPKLLSYVTPTSPSPPQYVVESLLSIQAFFTPVLPDLPSSSSKPNHSQDDDPEFIYCTWLRSKFDELVESLIQLLLSLESDEILKEAVLDTLMEFVKLGEEGFTLLYSIGFFVTLCTLQRPRRSW